MSYYSPFKCGYVVIVLKNGDMQSYLFGFFVSNITLKNDPGEYFANEYGYYIGVVQY